MTASATIEVLAEPSRRQILDALRSGEQPVHTLVERLELGVDAFPPLEEIGIYRIIRREPDARQAILGLPENPLEPRFAIRCHCMEKSTLDGPLGYGPSDLNFRGWSGVVTLTRKG